MSEHLQIFSEGTAAQPEQRQPDLPLLTEAERHQILVEWNNTSAEYPRDKCVHHLFEEQVEHTPDAIAVVCEDHHLTYDELNTRANQLARYLQKRGVGPEVLVGICVERSLEMVVGLLGILKAGGAYVPLDPDSPQERLRRMLEESQPAVILTQERLREHLPDFQFDSLYLDQDWNRIATVAQSNLPITMTAEHLAYVIYTSGSTGIPKGITVPHRAIVRLVCNTDYVTLHPPDRVAHLSNPSFDAATFEIWGALLNGASLIIVPHEVVMHPDRFAAQIRGQSISTLFVTTALFNQWAQHVPEMFRSVREVLFGGEAVDPKWPRRILEHGAPERLLHVYGPTESTTFTSWHVVQNVSEKATTVSIGRPIANTTIYLLNPHLQPVPFGVPGEMYIGGDGLARGYLNQPELTAEHFIPNPFSEQPGTRLYKTGDAARYLPDGNIEFLGRFDDQVKIRGFRVELGEIEAELNRAPAVREAIVLARGDLSGSKQLVAYVVPPQESVPTPGELRGFLKKRLPEYMIPSIFVMLDALPLTSSGKVDRRALPVPGQARPGPEEAFVAPRTPVEEILAGIWAEVLGIERVGIHDDFFELGGHSLKATQVMSRIRQQYQVELPLHVFLEKPTIKESAAAVEQAKGSSAEHQRPTISRIPREAYRKRLTSQP